MEFDLHMMNNCSHFKLDGLCSFTVKVSSPLCGNPKVGVEPSSPQFVDLLIDLAISRLRPIRLELPPGQGED